jgi:hypothetical protein
VVSIVSDSEHVPPDGKLRVYRSRTGGNNAEPPTNGPPQEHCYVNVLRVPIVGPDFAEIFEIFAALRRPRPATGWTTAGSTSAPIIGVFDTTGGQVYCSPDGGDHFNTIDACRNGLGSTFAGS